MDKRKIPEKMKVVGKEGIYQIDGMKVSVIIRNARLRPENVDYLIEPTAGHGSIWVNADSIKVL